MSLVTIGIPVFNEAEFLEEAIQSACSQTLTDIDIIISDNASTDTSYDIARKYSGRDSRIRVIKQIENIGPMNNFRYLLDEANTPYFAWLGGHDVFEKDYLEMAVNCMVTNPNIVMAYPANAIIIDDGNNCISEKGCSAIDTIGIKTTLKRVKHIIENLSICTNIHGVFKTDILRKLPFEKTFGPDFLMLSMAGLHGDIASFQATGIRRRKVRDETKEEAMLRWEEVGIFSKDENESPYSRLVNLHISHIKNSNQVGFIDYISNFRKLRKSLYKKFGRPK